MENNLFLPTAKFSYNVEKINVTLGMKKKKKQVPRELLLLHFA